MATKPKAAVINDLYRGGIADSKYSRVPNSATTLIGLDIHSILGKIQVNQKLAKISSTTITGKVTKILPCSDGIIYVFDTDGKVYKYTGGTFSYVVTASPAAGSAAILDAYEFEGYIYYSMQSRLGRVAVGSPTDWTTRNDSYQTFTKTDADYHPITDQNGYLYIGDGNLIAELKSDGTTFTANKLDLEATMRVTCLEKYGTDLAIGTLRKGNEAKANVFFWNTWSPSYIAQDSVDEVGINAFIVADNTIFVQAGINGNIYYISSYTLVFYKQIPGVYNSTSYMKMYANASANLNGKPLFGISNGSGNPCNQGVYSIFQKDASIAKVLNLEYPISERSSGEYVTTGIEITAMMVTSNDLYVAWKNGSTYGLDKIDYSVKLEKGIIETRAMRIDRHLLNRYTDFYATYESLPESTSIVFKYKKNHATSFSAFTNSSINDVDRMLVQLEEAIEASVLELRIEINTNSNNSPIIEDILAIFM